jgi:hypothetical protein
MSDNNENVLAVLRLLLAAFLVLILVIVINLALVIARANAAPITIRAGYPQLNSGPAAVEARRVDAHRVLNSREID